MKLPYLLLASLALASSAGAANVIVNGGFEAGDFTGWTVTDTETDKSYTIESTNPLSGSHSARQVRTTGSRSIAQTFTPFTSTATVGFLFSADYGTPTGGDRVLHLFLQGDTGTVNLRVNNSGTLQTLNRVNNVVSWENTGISGLTLDGTMHSVSINLNSFGAGASYDIAVGATTITGLTTFDNGAPSDLRTLRFEANSNSINGFTLLDNVSVIPEPSTALVGGLGLLALLRRRRSA